VEWVFLIPTAMKIAGLSLVIIGVVGGWLDGDL